jgi:hypothetical protein
MFWRAIIAGLVALLLARHERETFKPLPCVSDERTAKVCEGRRRR